MPSNNIKIIFAILAIIIIILIFPSTTIAFSVHGQIANPKNALWTSGKPSPVSKMESAYATIDYKIYIIAGYGETGKRNKNSVEVYDAKTDTWNTTGAAPLLVNVNHAAAAAYNGKIYLAGGFLDNKVLSDKLFIYDPVKNKWQEGKTMPTARGALAAAFINGILYAVGGQSSSSSPQILATNEAYDPISNMWTSKAPMPTARHHAGSAVVDGKLYVIGGRVNGISHTININVNEMYDPENDRWITLEPMPSKRSGISAAASVNNSSIYVFGGEEPSKTFNNNEKYDTKSNKWTSEPPMLTPRHGLGAVAIDDDKIYVIGGGPEPGLSVSNVNEIFHIVR